MTDQPPPERAAPDPPPLVDTTPATPERAGVTYGILSFVLVALLIYFVLRIVRGH